jgi:hypothetical protein
MFPQLLHKNSGIRLDVSVYLLSSLRATCPAHLILHDLIVLMICGKGKKQ